MLRANGLYARPQRTIVYGPLQSRRLGLSLGINLFPGLARVCAFDCSYCFIKQESSGVPATLVSADEIVAALDAFTASPEGARTKALIRYLTFSGNGEPTLHPHFPEIVDRVIKWSARHADNWGLAIFSNGTQLNRPDVAEALLRFDRVYLKFDWGSDEELAAIARPLQPTQLDEVVNVYADFCARAKQHPSGPSVVLEAAMYDRSESPDSLHRWAQLIKRIAPPAVDCYELDFAGRSLRPDENLDFHAFQRHVYELLCTEPIKVQCFYTGRFYVNVDLCCAVDSLIYLPLYVADFAKVFHQQGIRVNYFASPDGDRGAVDAIVSGRAQFALCDPQAALDILVDKREGSTGDKAPVLVAVLIKRIALWGVSDAGAQSPREAVLAARRVTTYAEGSTANYVWEWQREGLPEGAQVKRVEPVQPGDEFRGLCPNGPTEGDCVITADLLGAEWCVTHCKNLSGGRTLSLVDYSAGFRKPFLFTGLLASREVIREYPRAVDGVRNGLLKAVSKLEDDKFIERNRRGLSPYLERIVYRQQPWYIARCKAPAGDLGTAIDRAVEKLRGASIYSRDGRLRFAQLFRALLFRRGLSRRTKQPSVSAMLSWIDRRACRVWTRVPLILIQPILWLSVHRPVQLLVGTLLALVLGVFMAWLAIKDLAGASYLWGTLSAVLGSLSAAAVFAGYISIGSRKGGWL